MTKREALSLWRTLTALSQSPDPVPVRFGYAVALNKRRIAPVVESLQDAAKTASEAVRELDQQRMALAMKHAVLENGSPKIDRDGNILIANLLAYRADVGALEVSSSAAVAEGEKFRQDYEALLDSDAGVELVLAAVADLPPALPLDILDKLVPMIAQ